MLAHGLVLLAAALARAATPIIDTAGGPASLTTSATATTHTASTPAAVRITMSEPLPSALKQRAFTAGALFPTGVFAAFWSGAGPSATGVQPQPRVTDPVGGALFPLNLTSPTTIPEVNLVDPVVFPPALLSNATDAPIGATANLSTPLSRTLAAQTVQQIQAIIHAPNSTSECDKCKAGLVAAQALARIAPWEVPGVMIQLCNLYHYDSYGTCAQNFGQTSDGAVYTQVLALADVAGQDGAYICAEFVNGYCDVPAANPLDVGRYITSKKPANAHAPKPSGERIRVLHVSDFHLDPRYATGSEANCSDYLCCRSYSSNTHSPNTTLAPAPRFGAYKCDTPYSLAGAALQAIPALAGPFDFGIFTGDLVSHDNDNQLSRAYTRYEEASVFGMLKHVLGGAALYPTLGNHDTWPQAFNAPLGYGPAEIQNEFSWDYSHVASLWQEDGWLDKNASAYASVHYGAYAITTKRGLKIISFNTDFWYSANAFIYVNTTDPDISGQFAFMVSELEKSERANERVWIVGHVPPGWDAYSSLPNPTNLFYAIVDRFAPHVIAEIFFGHNHEDEFSVFYANNGTRMAADTAVATSWITPSLTPLSNLNSGFRAYDVDPVTFNILDAYTWISNISAAHALDGQSAHGAVYSFEYSAREAYGADIAWPAAAPLNATWWHMVTEQWQAQPALVELFTQFQGKNSVLTTNCTSAACVESKICYARSGSYPLAGLCPYGSKYGSVQ